jgi:hypothetical protein
MESAAMNPANNPHGISVFPWAIELGLLGKKNRASGAASGCCSWLGS